MKSILRISLDAARQRIRNRHPLLAKYVCTLSVVRREKYVGTEGASVIGRATSGVIFYEIYVKVTSCEVVVKWKTASGVGRDNSRVPFQQTDRAKESDRLKKERRNGGKEMIWTDSPTQNAE